jgi:hypothetical protein
VSADLASGCGGSTGDGNARGHLSASRGKSQDYTTVKRVLESSRSELMRRIPNAIGTGIGSPTTSRTPHPVPPTANAFVITVYLKSPAEVKWRSFDGIPLKLVVTGPIRAQ